MGDVSEIWLTQPSLMKPNQGLSTSDRYVKQNCLRENLDP
jgi:hypothetical protein